MSRGTRSKQKKSGPVSIRASSSPLKPRMSRQGRSTSLRPAPSSVHLRVQCGAPVASCCATAAGAAEPCKACVLLHFPLRSSLDYTQRATKSCAERADILMAHRARARIGWRRRRANRTPRRIVPGQAETGRPAQDRSRAAPSPSASARMGTPARTYAAREHHARDDDETGSAGHGCGLGTAADILCPGLCW